MIKTFEGYVDSGETLLNYEDSNVPYVTKVGDKYYITNNKGYEGKTEYTDDPKILLDAIKNVKSLDYQGMFKGKSSTKEEYWQRYFDYMYTGTGGLVMWQNPTEAWKSELSRRGELVCDKCGGMMLMYYNPTCFKCEKPTPDKKGRYMLIPVCYYVALKNGLEYREVWEAISDANGNYGDFYYSNDTSADLYYTQNAKVDKYIKMIDEEFPVETTNFFVSW